MLLTMKITSYLIIASLGAMLVSHAKAQSEISADVRQDEFSLSRGHLAIKGYDPVSYH